MADTFLSFGVEKLWDLLVRESERLQGVDGQFNGLKNDLNMLKSFLKDADAKKHTSETVRNTVKEIKEIVLDAEDIVQTFLLKEELGKTSGIKGCVRRFSCVITERRGIALDMEAISQRISKVIRDMQSLGLQQISNESYIKSIEERQRRMRQTFSSDNKDHLVGLEEKVNQLVGYLIEEDSNSQVVSITGMGGIGKTTLARQVFNHETIKNHFPGLVWVCLSQQFTREHVWRTMLQKLRPESEVLKMMDEQVQEKLFQVLETQKALVVLDDIWREEDWDMIKPVFPPGKGWKILLTSRIEGVALRADPKCFTFKPDFLTDEESWTLFRRKPVDPEEELRWMSQEVRGYVEAVLNSLAANVPKAVVLCQVEKSKEDMLNQLYSSISAIGNERIESLIQEDQNVKRRRDRYQKQSSLLSKLTRQLSIHDNRAAAASSWSDSGTESSPRTNGGSTGEDWMNAFNAAASGPDSLKRYGSGGHSRRYSDPAQNGEDDSSASGGSNRRTTPNRLPPAPPPQSGSSYRY